MPQQPVVIDLTVEDSPGDASLASAPQACVTIENDFSTRDVQARQLKRTHEGAFGFSSDDASGLELRNNEPCSKDDTPPNVISEERTCMTAFVHHHEDSQKSQTFYAVKVGWFPGVYKVKSDAKLQVKHYPLAEADRFRNLSSALEWLDELSANSVQDAKNRPEHFERVGRQAWTIFLGRTWSSNGPDVAASSKDVMRKLRELFLEASRLEEHEIDWSQHPVPAELLRDERESERPAGIIMSYSRLRGIISDALTTPFICSCREPAMSAHETVTCSNDLCKIRQYHRRCVGLLNRKSTEHWRCRACRPDPFAALTSIDVLPTITPLPSSDEEPQLHPEQTAVVDAIVLGQKNVFYTGSAGTGKSTVLKAFVRKLESQGKHVDIITPSGISAINVGGTTIYAYAGWHPESFKRPLKELVQSAFGKTVHKRLCATDVLVIDEISMVESDLFYRLDALMRTARNAGPPGQVNAKANPFGGVQVVVTGDFCQLPPVRPFRFCVFCGGDELPGHSRQDGRPLECPRCRRTYEDEAKWVFNSDSWANCRFLCFELRQVHRQSDVQFINLLQRCRLGLSLTPADKQLLLTKKPDPPGAVKLLPRRNEVDKENRRNFDALHNTIHSYECLDCFEYRSTDEPELRKKGLRRYPERPFGPLMALKDHRFDELVHIKQGMLVILLVNLNFDAGLVNGAQGCVVGFEPHNPSKVFEPIRAAPSSPRLGRGRGRNDEQFKKRKHEMQEFREQQVKEYVSRARCTDWPIIKFQNGITHPIYPHCLISELGSEMPYSLIGRTQVPLIAAWAITIHKSQGMTLNRVIVDLQSSFEKEQVYVALSRARSLEGLKVLSMPHGHANGLNRQVHEFLTRQGLMASDQNNSQQSSETA